MLDKLSKPTAMTVSKIISERVTTKCKPARKYLPPPDRFVCVLVGRFLSGFIPEFLYLNLFPG